MTFDVEAMKEAGRIASQEVIDAEPAPRTMVNGGFVYPDGTIHSKVTVEETTVPPDGLIFVEGDFDLQTDRLDMSVPVTVAQSSPVPPGTYPVIAKTEMQLSYPATVPADGVTELVVTGIPERTNFFIVYSDGERRDLTAIDDGVLELTFDTPDIYQFVFMHQGYLETTISVEAVST